MFSSHHNVGTGDAGVDNTSHSTETVDTPSILTKPQSSSKTVDTPTRAPTDIPCKTPTRKSTARALFQERNETVSETSPGFSGTNNAQTPVIPKKKLAAQNTKPTAAEKTDKTATEPTKPVKRPRHGRAAK